MTLGREAAANRDKGHCDCGRLNYTVKDIFEFSKLAPRSQRRRNCTIPGLTSPLARKIRWPIGPCVTGMLITWYLITKEPPTDTFDKRDCRSFGARKTERVPDRWARWEWACNTDGRIDDHWVQLSPQLLSTNFMCTVASASYTESSRRTRRFQSSTLVGSFSALSNTLLTTASLPSPTCLL